MILILQIIKSCFAYNRISNFIKCYQFPCVPTKIFYFLVYVYNMCKAHYLFMSIINAFSIYTDQIHTHRIAIAFLKLISPQTCITFDR